MNYVKLRYNGRSYDYDGSNDISMDIIGQFLLSDVGCYGDVYKTWALDSANLRANGNLIALEKNGNAEICLTDMYNQNTEPGLFLINRDQFVQLLDDWKEKVYEHKPKTVIIKHDGIDIVIEASHS